MIREKQLIFCERCSNRKMDLEQGLVCNLTGEKATFQNECQDFKLDIKLFEFDDKESLQPSEIIYRLSPEIIEKLKMEQNPVQGIICGLVAGIAGAILWASLTGLIGDYLGLTLTYYRSIILTTPAIGAGVGLTIRKFGNGIDSFFGYWGAVISLCSVLLGCFLATVDFIAYRTGLGYFETFSVLDYSLLPQTVVEIFNWYILIICLSFTTSIAYHFSLKKITEKRIIELKEMNS